MPGAGGALRALPARAIAASIAGAAQRWTDADFPTRVRATAAIAERTAYSEPVIDAALDRLFSTIDADVLERTIAGELGSLTALDGFVQRPGRPDAYAARVGRVAIVSSDTTIGVSIPPAIFALCAKCDVVVRDRSDELCAAFRATLAKSARVSDAFAVYPPSDHDDPAWLRELGRADTVVAFGDDAALAAVRSATGAQARFIAFGHRTSVGYVAREALASEAAATHFAERLARTRCSTMGKAAFRRTPCSSKPAARWARRALPSSSRPPSSARPSNSLLHILRRRRQRLRTVTPPRFGRRWARVRCMPARAPLRSSSSTRRRRAAAVSAADPGPLSGRRPRCNAPVRARTRLTARSGRRCGGASTARHRRGGGFVRGGTNRAVRYVAVAVARGGAWRDRAHRAVRALDRSRNVNEFEAIVTEIPGPRSRALALELRAVEPRGVTFVADDFPTFWAAQAAQR